LQKEVEAVTRDKESKNLMKMMIQKQIIINNLNNKKYKQVQIDFMAVVQGNKFK